MKLKYLPFPFAMILITWFVISQESEVAIPEATPQVLKVAPAEPLVWDNQEDNLDKVTLVKAVQRNSDETLNPIERIRKMSNKTELQVALLDDHDNFTRYPPENRRITSAAQDPITQRYAIDERTTLNEDQSVGLTVWSDKKFYLEDDTVIVHAFIQDAEGKKITTEFQTEIISDLGKHGALKLIDDNNDQIYTAQLKLSDSSRNIDKPGIYKVLIQNKEHEILDGITFTLSKPDIALTYNFREKITASGDLLIEAEVDVSQNNRFYIQASLYSSTHVPVGVTQSTQELTSGKHWIPLQFAGLMIQDAQENGPYVLQQVSLAKVTMPMQRAPLVNPGFQTDAYRLDEFSNNTYNEQDKLN